MLDFVIPLTDVKKNGDITVTPDYDTYASSDLMIKGGTFYAIFDESKQLWSTSEYTARCLIDAQTQSIVNKLQEENPGVTVKGKFLKYNSTGLNKAWMAYYKGLPDNYKPLDEEVIFNNTITTKESYASHKLPYDLVEGKCEAYDEIMSTLYDPSEREKLEWAIGSIISGDSKTIQKFIVLYGDKGTGKSTVLNIYQSVLDGYWSVFTAKDLARSNADFALESFKNNPLLAIQHDGDLSRIEDNTKLNSIISHEPIEINEKRKSKYMLKLNSFLFMGTNHPVKITDSKSGILRRLIDVSPSGRKIPIERYYDLVNRIKFEKGPIAFRCFAVYKYLGKNHYENYKPMSMMGATNDFFNFVEDQFFEFQKLSKDGVSLGSAWKAYQEYVKEANVPYPMSKMRFKDELKNYFDKFVERDGRYVNIYYGFRESIFKFDGNEGDTGKEVVSGEVQEVEEDWLDLKEDNESWFNTEYSYIPAQYCKIDESGKPIPKVAWSFVKTFLSEIDTRQVHFCRPPEKLIDIDFDLKDENGNKSLELCIEAARSFKPTYAEVSQGGNGLHLYYIYDGDVSELEPLYSKDIEVKIHTGKRALRRRLSKCNNLKVEHIYSGLPIKRKEEKMLDESIFEGEKKLRNVIEKALRKDTDQPYTAPCIQLIDKVLNQAYDSGQHYDVRDMRGKVQTFAAGSKNQALTCSKIVSNMHFCSKDVEEGDIDGYILATDDSDEDKPIVIYDIESYENLFGIGYKIYDEPGHEGEHKPQFKLFPDAAWCKQFMRENRLVGFNNKKYDDPMLYLAAQGATVKELYNNSQGIVSNQRSPYVPFKSYADVLDFSKDKKSLKWFEINLLSDKVEHQEMAIKWDEPVPEDMFDKVAEYCMNDVLATEALWNHPDRQKDWAARKILAEISGKPVGESNNNHSKALMFEGERNPQREFIYTDLSIEFPGYEHNEKGIDKNKYNKDENGKPIFTTGKSIYMDEDPSEGGYAWGKKGMYGNVVAFDVSSMHPSTMIWLNIFGDRYTARLKQIVDLRKALKHGDLDYARTVFDGRLAKYLEDPKKTKGLDGALKIVINSIYGLTAAHFPNEFKDERNVDNIVAKRGALFMIRLKHMVQDMGYEVVHCKTDCIKVADADEKISNFIVEEGKRCGYDFEVEHRFDKFCLTNKSAYIGRLKDENGELGGWVPVADEFKEPFVFKTLFSKEEVTFEDLQQTKSAKSAMFLDMNEDLGKMDPILVKEMEKLEKKLKKGEANEFDISRYDELCKEEAKYHNYIFVGKQGAFVPIKPGYGGGELLRDQNGKMNAVESTSGYRWLESSVVKGTDLETHAIDMSYFTNMAEAVVADVSQWGDFDWFVSDEKYTGTMRIPITAEKAIKRLEDETFMNKPLPEVNEFGQFVGDS